MQRIQWKSFSKTLIMINKFLRIDDTKALITYSKA